MKKTITTLILILSLSASAQQQENLIIHLGGGIAGLQNKGEAKNTNGMGFQFGVDYQYFINPSFSVSAGLGLASYKSKATLSSAQDQYQVGEFEFRTNISDYKETQTAMMLTVPIMAYFHHDLDAMGIYAGAGFKLGLPVSGKYNADVAEINNRGYFPDLNQELDEPRFMGFGQFTDLSASEKLNLKTAFSLAIDLGVKWPNLIMDRYALYAGLYFDLGLNNIQKTENTHLIQYQTSDPENFKLGGLTHDAQFTKSVKPISFGIKIKVAI